MKATYRMTLEADEEVNEFLRGEGVPLPSPELIEGLLSDEVEELEGVKVSVVEQSNVVVLAGNPMHGLQVFGPFKDEDDGITWAAENLSVDGWWTATLAGPK